MLGNRAGFRVPEGGFFLWLDVGNGEETALRLWREAGVRVLPGAYMGRESEPGKPQSNPGFSYIRVALVSDLSTIMTALEDGAKFLGNGMEPGSAIRMVGRRLSAPVARRGDERCAGRCAPRAGAADPLAIAARRRRCCCLWRRWRRWLALASYYADDASLNNANGRAVANLLGPLGATAADMLLQAFGIAALCASRAARWSGACAR